MIGLEIGLEIIYPRVFSFYNFDNDYIHCKQNRVN